MGSFAALYSTETNVSSNQSSRTADPLCSGKLHGSLNSKFKHTNSPTLRAPEVKESHQFDWNPAHQEAYNKIKDSISSEVTLTYFDPKKEITLQVNATLKGLGAILLQDNKPVAFASKALTDVATRYANIERDVLAVV